MKGFSPSHNLSRREALLVAGTTAVCGAAAQPATANQADPPGGSFQLSEQGSGRATGYAEANKIVTHNGRTHVAWLDSPPEGFRVRVRTLDHATGRWSPTYTIGKAHDNHGGPALSIDSEGFLHVVYFPHHHAMRYRKSQRPDDASSWESEVAFGERLTYPTLVCGEDNTLYLTARRSFSDRPWLVELWKKPPRETWQRGPAILAARVPGYAHFQESLAWSPDHRTLHLCCRFHESSDGEAYGRRQSVAYLVSPDQGATWLRRDGRQVELPATAATAEVLESGGVDQAKVLRAGAIAVAADGRPHLVYSVEAPAATRLILARPRADSKWQRIDLTQFLPASWSTWNLTAPAGLTFTSKGEMVVTAQIEKSPEAELSWGNRTNEVVAFRASQGGARFRFATISAPDPQRANWLPNIERATGHHQVGDQPGVIYTSGGPGEGLTDLLANEVRFATVNTDTSS